MKERVTRRMAVSGLVGAAIGPQAVLAQGTAERSSAPAVAAGVVADPAGFRQGGDSAGLRLLAEKAGEILSLADFPDPQRALDQAFAERATIVAPRGTYQTSGLRLQGHALIGLGATFRRSTGTRPVITIPSNPAGLQTTDVAVLRDVEIDSALDGQRTGIGVLIENSAIAEIGSVRVQGAAVGIAFDRCQFAPGYNLKCFDNDVGMLLRPSRKDGGANSITLTHPVAVNNIVGVIIDNSDNALPQADIVLVNPQILVNTVCGIAVLGRSSINRTQLTILGAAPEANALSSKPNSTSWAHEGKVIPRSSVYARNALINMFGVFIAEYATTNPCVILESATLNLSGVNGYGGPSSVVVQADGNSSVSISGVYGLIGTCHGVVSFSGHLDRTTSQGALVGPVRETITHLIPNQMPDPDVAGYAESVGVASAGFGFDARGRYARIAFAGRRGSADSNSARFRAGGKSAARAIYRLEVTSSADTRVRLSYYPDDISVVVDLLANQPSLIVVFGNEVTNASGLIVLYPVSDDAPVLQVRNGHSLSGSPDDQVFLAHCDAICGGAFNPVTPGAIALPAQSAAPTSAAYPVGARIPNAAPGSGKPLEWVHSGGGTWLAISLP